MLAQLLSCYQNVFSQSDQEVEQIDLTKHSILTLLGTRPIHLSPLLLGPDKKLEVE